MSNYVKANYLRSFAKTRFITINELHTFLGRVEI